MVVLVSVTVAIVAVGIYVFLGNKRSRNFFKHDERKGEISSDTNRSSGSNQTEVCKTREFITWKRNHCNHIPLLQDALNKTGTSQSEELARAAQEESTTTSNYCLPHIQLFRESGKDNATADDMEQGLCTNSIVPTQV